MTTRIYFPTTTGLPSGVTVSPSSSWQNTSGYTTHTCYTTKQDTALSDGTARTKPDAVDQTNRLDRIYVSNFQLSAGTISAGTFSAVFKGVETNVNFNAWLQIIIKVVSSDGQTVRGTIYGGSTASFASQTSGNEAQEFPLTGSKASRIKNAIATSAVTAQAGDRIQIEIGYRADNDDTSRTVTLEYGDPTSGTDMSSTSAGATTGVPWLELSALTLSTTQSGAVSLSASTTLSAAGTVSTTLSGAVSLSASASMTTEGSIGAVNLLVDTEITVASPTLIPIEIPDAFTTTNAREMATYAIVLEGTGDILQGAVSLTVNASLLSGEIVGAGSVVLTASATLEVSPKQIVPVFPIGGTFSLSAADNTAAYIITLESLAVDYPGQVSMVATSTMEVTEYKVQGAVSLTAIPTFTAKSENFGSALLTQTPTIIVIGFVDERFAQVVQATLTIQGPLYRAEAQVQLSAVVAFRIAARTQKAPIFRTNYPYPVLPHGFRVIAQKILTGEIIDWELPVSDNFEYTRQLSGPTVMKGSFKPEIRSVQELNLDGYAVMFHVEIDNVIRASGVMLPPQYSESSLDFTCEGFAAVPHYLTWDTSFSGIEIDSFDIVRKIWEHVQALPTSNLGVQLPTSLSGRTFGTPPQIELVDPDGKVIQGINEPPRIRAARLILARKSAVNPTLFINEDWSWVGMPDIVEDWNDDLVTDFQANGPQPDPENPTAPNDQTWLTKLIADWETANVPLGTKTRQVDAEPYELQWWNGTNCGEEFDKLAGDTPFDYVERVGWNEDKTDVDFYLDLGYPRIGTQRPDLVFNEDNILEVVPAQEGEDTYASAVLVVGAGEGAATIRGYASQSFGERIRKTVVVTDKSITTQERANQTALAELGIRRGKTFEITELVLAANHQNAPLGSYDLGDDIAPEVFVPWLNYWHRDWYRITSITYQPNRDHVRLGIQRSDSFRYPVVSIPNEVAA